MDMRKQINMYLFIFMKCILIKIKFEIDINNNELLKNHMKT
jgi:hypothetical protein